MFYVLCFMFYVLCFMFYVLYLFLNILDIDERHSVRDYHASSYRGVLPSQTSTLPFSYGYERRGEGEGGTERDM